MFGGIRLLCCEMKARKKSEDLYINYIMILISKILIYYYIIKILIYILSRQQSDASANFSRFWQLVEPAVRLCFLFSCFLGSWEKNHPNKHPLAQLSPLHILYWCLYWVTDFGYWTIRENVQEKQLYHPPLQALYWIDVLLVCRGFGFSCLKVWFVFFKPGITKSDI